MVEDWTIVYTPSSPSTSSSTTPIDSPFPSPTMDTVHLPLPIPTTPSSHSHSVTRTTASATTGTTGGAKRPTMSRRNSPSSFSSDGLNHHNHVLSLVRPHEPIDIPVPPSLKAKGMRSKSFEGGGGNNNTPLLSSSFSPSQKATNAAWYDYDEFGPAARAVFMSDRSPSPSPSFSPSTSPSFLSRSYEDQHHHHYMGNNYLPTSRGPSPILTPPRLPPSPLLYPSNMEMATQKHNPPSPLALPKPVLRPSKTWA